jgi:hypothetical protein
MNEPTNQTRATYDVSVRFSPIDNNNQQGPANAVWVHWMIWVSSPQEWMATVSSGPPEWEHIGLMKTGGTAWYELNWESGRKPTISKVNGANRQHIPGVDEVLVLGLENKRQQSATATHHWVFGSPAIQRSSIVWLQECVGRSCAMLCKGASVLTS